LNSDRFGGQSHLILPVVLASVALLAIGFAVAALVGTGASAATAASTGTLTYVHTSVQTVNGKPVTVTKQGKVRFKIKHIPAKTVMRNGKVVTLPAHTQQVVETLPGKVVVHKVTAPGKTRTTVQTHTNTVTNTAISTVFNTITNTATVFNTVTQTETVTGPGVTVTVTVPTT
jgi:hypothetical protein